MSQLQKVDVIIFVGPPLSGRTLYYYQELSSSHVRISAAELYRSDPRANLRIVIQKIVAELKKGHKVVIDDGNIQRQTRLSYISGISKKVPGCSFGCLQFTPENGSPQLELCRGWSLAQWAWYNLLLLSREDQLVLPVPDVFEGADPLEKQDVALDWDKFDVISTIFTPLVCPSSHQLTSPILVIEWEGMLESTNRRCSIKKGVSSAFQKWSSTNPTGHIVVVQDGRQSNAEADVLRAEMIELLVPIVNELPTQHPLYCIIVKSECNAYVQCAHSGFLAFVEYLFTASLRHKSSLYVHHSKLDQARAEQMGMRTAPASKVFQQPHTVTTVHCTEQEPFTLLQKTVYTDHRQSLIFKNGLSSPKLSAALRDISSDMRSLPLCNLARLLEQASSAENTSAHVTYKPNTLEYSLEFGKVFSGSVKCVTAETVVGVTLGLLYRDLGALERFQECYQKSLKTVTEMTVDFGSSNTGRSPQQEPLSDSFEDNSGSPGCFQFPVLQYHAIQEHAMDSGTYARGLEYQEHVCDVREEGKSRLVGKVQSHDGKGTSGISYVVSAHIDRDGRITGSHCSCKAGVRRGRCKHVVALLLIHFKKQTTESIATEASVVKDTLKGQRKQKRKSNDLDSYRLSEADLLDTAMEVIEMYKTQRKQPRHSENGTEFKAAPNRLETSLPSIPYSQGETDCLMDPVKVLQRQSMIPDGSDQYNLLRESFTGSSLPNKQDLGIIPPQSSLVSEHVQEAAPSLLEQLSTPSKEMIYAINTSVHSTKSVDSAYVSNTVKETTPQAKDLLDELFL